MTTTPEATEPADPPSWRTGLPIVDARAERAIATLLVHARATGLTTIDTRAMAILASHVDASDRTLATITRALVAAVDEAMTTIPYYPPRQAPRDHR